jgi:four helix bundle protein
MPHPLRMRDHTKLQAYQAADQLAIAVYKAVKNFPSDERFGLSLQLRRAAVSAAANIVEGCARITAPEYARFLSIAYASAREAQYEIDLATRLGYINGAASLNLNRQAADTTRLLSRLASSVKSFGR